MKPTLAMLKTWEANKNPMAKPSGRDQKVGFDVKGQCIIKNNMGVSENGGFPPKSSILIWISIFKSSIFGVFSPYFWKHPICRNQGQLITAPLDTSLEVARITRNEEGHGTVAGAFKKRWRKTLETMVMSSNDPSTFPSTFFLNKSHLKRYQSKRRKNHVPSISFARFISETHILEMEQTIANHNKPYFGPVLNHGTGIIIHPHIHHKFATNGTFPLVSR